MESGIGSYFRPETSLWDDPLMWDVNKWEETLRYAGKVYHIEGTATENALG